MTYDPALMPYQLYLLSLALAASVRFAGACARRAHAVIARAATARSNPLATTIRWPAPIPFLRLPLTINH